MFYFSRPRSEDEAAKTPPQYPMCPNCQCEWHGLPIPGCKGSLETKEHRAGKKEVR